MEVYNVLVTPSADKDLDEIFSYVSEELLVPNTALKLIDTLYEALYSLSDMPKRNPLSRDTFLAKQGFHVLYVESYLVFYTVDEPEKQVVVHRVLYAKRNYKALF